MTLQSGSRLGPYEVLSLIGAGGMGEVYKAKDTRLDRTVAIKVLPSHLSEDVERRERFEREARAVSSLNHPHICTLYDVGEQKSTHYLVMEYIEGESLADRLKKGPLPLEQAIRYGIQIADALDKAHRAGVVHRDLKPGNIMLIKTGAKLLDFGLAKLRESAQEDMDLSALPTAQKPLTEKGAILGTFQYMAPEQLEGTETDARTDIFAFGAMLYEMLTGRKAFEGKSQASLIAAILEHEPVPLTDLQPLTPPALDHVIRTCLDKDPDRRWQSAGDLARELEWTSEAGMETGVPLKGKATRRPLVTIGLLIIGALLVGAVGGYLIHPESPTSSPFTRLTIPLPPEQQSASANPVLSPDGRHLVFQGSNELYLRSLNQLEAKPIPGTEGATYPFFSPDSRWIGFFSKGTLQKALVSGSAPVRICAAPGYITGASWGPHDIIVFGESYSDLMKVSANGGTVEQLTSQEGGRHATPRILPDGKNVLFTTVGEEGPSIALVSLETGEYRKLLDGSHPNYVSTGHLLLIRSGNLLAVPFDLVSLEITGSPVPVLDGLFTYLMSGWEKGLYAVSNTGSLVYAPGGQVIAGRWGRLVWVNREGRSTPFSEEVSTYLYPRFSPDGTRVAVSRQTEEIRNIWLYDVERSTSMRFTFQGNQFIPCWTPDSEWLAFDSDHGGQGIYWKSVDGSTPLEALSVSRGALSPGSWSPNGTLLAYHASSPVTKRDIWIWPKDANAQSFPFANTEFNEVAPVFSPDGQFLAFVSDESGQNEVYVQPYPGPGEKQLVSTDGGIEPVWSSNGREFFYRHGNEMLVVDTELEPELRLGQPRVLFRGAFVYGTLGMTAYDVSPDDQRFVMVEISEDSAPTQFNVILNWHEELKKLVPSNE